LYMQNARPLVRSPAFAETKWMDGYETGLMLLTIFPTSAWCASSLSVETQ
jgi:hypothetical protein